MSLNVNRNVDDQFYRYKMPKLIAKVEGKGNGIKTVIVNMVEVAKAISRPPTYPTKFFGCELGAQTQFDLKNERFIVNGSHDASKLQELLHDFINRFVLCPNCKNPETDLSVNQKVQTIKQRCKACGYQGQLDLKHRLTTYIIRNPPGAEQGSGATPSKKDKKSKRKEKDARSSPEANGHQKEEAHIESPPANNNHKEEEEDDDDDWGDVDESTVNELSSAAQKLAMDDDADKTVEERMDIFYHFVSKKKSDGNVANADKEILAEAERLDVKDKAIMVVVEVLLSEKVLTEVKEYRKIFLRFTNENRKAQRYLLHALEQLAGVKYSNALLPKVPHILKVFYDLDIVEEEEILDWANKVSKRYVPKAVSQEIRNKAAPFINWLKEAEEEDESSDEDEEDEVEVVYSEAARKIETKTIKQAPPPKAATKPEPEEEEDDFDIDAI